MVIYAQPNVHYNFYHDGGKYFKDTFDIFETEGKWLVKGSRKNDSGDPAYYIDYEFLGVCNEYKKKEFLKLRKKGVK